MRYVEDFIGAIQKRQAEIAGSLVAGNATDMGAYQRLVGQHAGLQEALQILNNLLREDDDNSGSFA